MATIVKVGKRYEYDFSKEVARGAAALDELRPGWHRRVKKKTLDLENGNMCVLGQLATDQMFADAVGLNLDDYDFDLDERPQYGDAIDAMAQDGPVAQLIAADPRSYGFYLSPWGFRDLEGYDQVAATPWDALTWAWIAEIKDRRKADRAAKV